MLSLEKNNYCFRFEFLLGNVEIGNGYGVPGGGAYYGTSVNNVNTRGKNFSMFDLSKY